MKNTEVRGYVEANKQAIIDDYLSGLGGWDLCLKYNVSGTCIFRYLREWGIPIRTSYETKVLGKLNGKPVIPETEKSDIVVEEETVIEETVEIAEPFPISEEKATEINEIDYDSMETLRRSRKQKKKGGMAWAKIKHSPKLMASHKALKQHVNKLKKRCSLCGETNSDVLLFHHIDSLNKSDEISSMANRLMPMYQIRAEMAKCVVVCFNCHHIIHRKEFGDIFDDEEALA